MANGTIIELMDDMHLSSEELFHNYYDAVASQNISRANQIIEDNTSLQNQITDSDNINRLIKQTNEDEKMIKTDVDEYLIQQLEEFQNLINETVVMGTYSDTVQYDIHNLVYYQDKGYYAYKKPPIGTVPTNQEYWLEYDIRGLKGYGGINLNFKFAWDANTQYQIMDCVSYQNKLWFANQPNQNFPPNLNHFPWLPIMMPLKPVKTQITTIQPTIFMSEGDFWFKIVKGNNIVQTKWTDKAIQPYPRYASAIFTFGTEIHIVGGDNALDEKQTEHQVYDTLTNTWSEKAALPKGVSGQGFFTIGNKGYSVGGVDNNLQGINTLYIYDNTTNTWTTGADLPVALIPLMTGCTDGTLGYIATSQSAQNLPTNINLSYNPSTNTWTQLTDCPTYLAASSSVYYNGKIYVFNGIDYTGGTTDGTYIYDIATNAWSTGAAQGLSRAAASIFLKEDKVYVCGGIDGLGYSLANVKIYDITNNTWTNEIPMRHSRNSAQGAIVNGLGYVIGGININNDFGIFGFNEQFNPEG